MDARIERGTTALVQGLSADEAARRLAHFGPNATEVAPDHLWHRMARRFWEPVPWMLEAAIILQLMIGEVTEAAIIAALLVFNAGLALLQEGRAEAALAALKARLALTSVVRREGAWREVPAAELVPGDIIRLSLGGVVPADARIVDGSVLLDQSMLTGEAAPVDVGTGDTAYASALVRRGSALAEVTATGTHSYFGRTAELVRIAHAESGAQRAVVTAVRNLAVFNGAIITLLVGYAYAKEIPLREVIPLVLTALLASIPVALPATFTLAAALGAQALGKRGVLLTHLSAIHDAARVDVLCADKTGTLTQNALAVAKVSPLADGMDEDAVLGLAYLASAESGLDPVDAAIRTAALRIASRQSATVLRFTPFDPATKLSEALVTGPEDVAQRVIKGAPATVMAIATSPSDAAGLLAKLTGEGLRVLAVAAGQGDVVRLVGFIGLADPPRPDSAPLLTELRALGVETVMVTGDATGTACAVAAKIGLTGSVCGRKATPTKAAPGDHAIYAGVFPEDKYRLVKAFQRAGHTVAMCGDGANDAPALRQAEMGIAVSTATDVAKSAASLVLTEPGLAGILDAIREGRITFQRIRAYTLNALMKKVELVLFLAVGLLLTGQAVMTPMLMALLLITGDFITMALTTDHARPSPRPDNWHMGKLFGAAIGLGLIKLGFSLGVLEAGIRFWGYHGGQLRTLAFVTLVFGGQAVVYTVRERRRLWSSRPSGWLFTSSVLDIGLAGLLATGGILMKPLPLATIGMVLAAAALFALVLDTAKLALVRLMGDA